MNRGDRFLEEIGRTVLVGDGAVGTALFARGVEPETGVERMNVLDPDLVIQLHQDYVRAGSRVIETNTFGANLPNLIRYGVKSEQEARDVILAGTRLARLAAGDEVYVAGSVGPLPNREGEPIPPADQTAIFAAQVSALVEGDVDILIFESFNSIDELALAISIARSIAGVPVVAQAAFGREGNTADGADAEEVARRCMESGADIVGANCGYGVISVTHAALRMLNTTDKVSAYLNAGFPERIEGRLMYLPHEDYIVKSALDLVDKGVRLIGGCCGTDPDIIRRIAKSLPRRRHAIRVIEPQPLRADHVRETTALETPSLPGRILVEMDPPRTPDIGDLLNAAKSLKDAGASALTVSDNPLASVRVDTITVAGILQRETGIPIIPHLTGRDRNRLAIQSTIMGAHVLGIRSLLCVTGDPVRMCQDPNTSGVFDLTSVGLVGMVNEFNSGHRNGGECRTAFSIGVALNPNVRTVSGQVDKLKRKLDAGAHFALTQPVFDAHRLDVLVEVLADAGVQIPIYVGIMPLVSARAAEFLHNEVPGMLIPEEIRRRIQKHPAPADQRRVGLEIAEELVASLSGRTHGFYFICPRNRVELVLPLIGFATGAGMT